MKDVRSGLRAGMRDDRGHASAVGTRLARQRWPVQPDVASQTSLREQSLSLTSPWSAAWFGCWKAQHSGVRQVRRYQVLYRDLFLAVLNQAKCRDSCYLAISGGQLLVTHSSRYSKGKYGVLRVG